MVVGVYTGMCTCGYRYYYIEIMGVSCMVRIYVLKLPGILGRIVRKLWRGAAP